LLENGYPGTNYLFSTGSSIHTGGCADQTNANGVIAEDVRRRVTDIPDGTSNTILAAEYVPRTQGDPNSVFPVVASFPTIASRAFITQSELNQFNGMTVTRTVNNNGQWWAWHSHTDALINIAAPPNWKFTDSTGRVLTGGVGTGGAGLAWDSCLGIVPAQSKHSGGVNVCLADGSVRFIRDSIDLLTWQRLGNARDGAVPGDF